MLIETIYGNSFYENNMKKILSTLSLTVASTLLVVPAHAIVLEWGYSIDNHFSAATYTSGNGVKTPAGSGVTTLFWGNEFNNANNSSLVISNNPIAGSVDTYLGNVPPQVAPYLGSTLSLTHNNHVISNSAASLTTTTLSSAVVLTPLDHPLNPGFPIGPVPFNISFTETPNSGTCAVSDSPTKCNDIFVLTAGLLNFNFDYDAGDGDGLLTYYINIFPTSGGVLSLLENSACQAAGVAAGCVGFSTPENQSSTLDFGFTISSNPLNTVPEPGVLALVGLGLLSLAGIRRRPVSI